MLLTKLTRYVRTQSGNAPITVTFLVHMYQIAALELVLRLFLLVSDLFCLCSWLVGGKTCWMNPLPSTWTPSSLVRRSSSALSRFICVIFFTLTFSWIFSPLFVLLFFVFQHFISLLKWDSLCWIKSLTGGTNTNFTWRKSYLLVFWIYYKWENRQMWQLITLSIRAKMSVKCFFHSLVYTPRPQRQPFKLAPLPLQLLLNLRFSHWNVSVAN